MPARVIVYRDGVGDGQIPHVVDQEIPAIKKALAALGDLRFTYIIVSKRINTRFFKEDNRGQLVNPPSGSVFDDVVTLPER